VRRGTRSGTHFVDFSPDLVDHRRRLVELRGDLLPPIALIAPRGIATVASRNHLHVAMAKLPSHELVGCPGAHRANRLEVSRIMHSVMRDALCGEEGAMDIARRLAVDIA
jgi:hypothetical protein